MIVQKMLNWPAHEYGDKLVQHLRSRFMSGLPHIGVLGPQPSQTDDIDPVDVDDSSSAQTSILNNVGDELDWNFVPNKMKYQTTITPTENKQSKTVIDFYIRLDEGSDLDLIFHEKLDNMTNCGLSEDQLKKVFRHYIVIIENDASNSFKYALLVDGHEHEIPTSDIVLHKNSIEIRITADSNPFLVYAKGIPRIAKEKYEINITKRIKNVDKLKIISVDIVNNSNKTSPSVLPLIKDNEDKDEALQRIKLESKRKTDQEPQYWDAWKPKLFTNKNFNTDLSGNRYGYLMELQATEYLSSVTHPITPKDIAKIRNAVFDDSNLPFEDQKFEGNLIFRDHAEFREQVSKMKISGTPKEVCKTLGIRKEIAEMLQNDLHYANLYKFQEDSISKILDGVNSKKNTIMISARTAGGKTESFAIPILDECIKNDMPGVKAMICYPTKALANDQASRFISLIYHLNKRISKKITIGILHGDIPSNTSNITRESSMGLPIECPKCKTGLLVPHNPETVVCDNSKCNEALDFVWAHSRNQNYAHPPDILITNPDMLIWRLMLEPEHHSIFGRCVFACMDCGMTYAPPNNKNACNGKNGCGGRNLEKVVPSPPSFLVFDEVHLFKGSFGINTSYLLSRIENSIKHYAKTFHSKENHKIIRIGSTATISNSVEFVKKFFNVGENQYWIVPSSQNKVKDYETEKSDDSFSRHHVYLMPYAYTSDSTVGTTIQYLEALSKKGEPPTRLAEKDTGLGNYLQILAFVNSIKASNSLLQQTKRTIHINLPDIQIDGHTTDFDKSQRAIVERKFNMQDLHIVFATSTLEVGVDFRNIHCIVINGFPYSFNDYLQRIGRGGRRGDSLIVTVCQNWKPVDHYYYSHGPTALRSHRQNIEPIPITRDNAEVIKRHVSGALFDYILLNKDTKYNTDNITSLESIPKDRDEINKFVLAACGISKDMETTALLALDEFVSFMTQLIKNATIDGKSKSLYSRFTDQINPRFNLSSLRSTDPQVKIEVFWN